MNDREEPRPMKELHAIRERMTEEMKKVSPEEWTARLEREAQAYIERYHLRVKPLHKKVA